MAIRSSSTRWTPYDNNNRPSSSQRSRPSMKSRSDISIALALLDWEKARALARGVPDQASHWSKRHGFFEGVKPSHCLPLHEACVTTAPPITVAAILKAYPDGVRCKESSYNRLPLHCACRRARADVTVVRLLVGANKAACLVPDDMGRLPLHYALSNGANPAVIHALLSAHPQAAMGVDNLGWTPLHVACASSAPTGVIAALLHAYPDACVLRTTEKGSTPRRCLGKNQPKQEERKESLRLLLEAELCFDQKFVPPKRPILLTENHGVVLV